MDYQKKTKMDHRKITKTALRTLQFTFSIIVAAIYGVDLSHSSKEHTHGPTEWIYAEFVACVSAIACIVHFFKGASKYVNIPIWDFLLFVLWLAQTGVFGTLYGSGVKPGYEDATTSLSRMRAGIWIDMVNTLLWFATMVLGIAWCIRGRKKGGKMDRSDDDQEQGVVVVEDDCLSDSSLDEKRDFKEDTKQDIKG